MHAVQVLGAGLILLCLWTAAPFAAETKNPRSSFTIIKMYLCDEESRPKDRFKWHALLREMGLRPMTSPGEPDPVQMWSLSDATGEVRATSFFLKDRTRYTVLFFPVTNEAPPAPVVQWLLAQPSPNLQDGDSLEIKLPTLPQCGGSRAGEVALMSLTTGRLSRLSFSSEWLHK